MTAPPSSTTELPAEAACRDVIAWATRPTVPAKPAEALDLARILDGAYAQRSGAERPEVYLSMIVEVLVEHPVGIGERAIRAVVRRHPFRPAVAELQAAIDAVLADDARVVARAEWALKERARRAAERERAERGPKTEAERAAMAARFDALLADMTGRAA